MGVVSLVQGPFCRGYTRGSGVGTPGVGVYQRRGAGIPGVGEGEGIPGVGIPGAGWVYQRQVYQE